MRKGTCLCESDVLDVMKLQAVYPLSEPPAVHRHILISSIILGMNYSWSVPFDCHESFKHVCAE